MSKVDWYYIYSPRYYPFHYYLQDNINKDIFNYGGSPEEIFKHLFKEYTENLKNEQ